MELDNVITEVLVQNNKSWLNRDQVKYAIGEGRLPITHKDVHDIVAKLDKFSNRDRQMNILAKIESIRNFIRQAEKEGDMSLLVKTFLMNDLENLELQISNINSQYVESEK